MQATMTRTAVGVPVKCGLCSGDLLALQDGGLGYYVCPTCDAFPAILEPREDDEVANA